MKTKFFQALAVAIALLLALPAFAAKKIMWDGFVVYQESVQTDVTPSVTIPLEGLDADGGTVSVTDGENLIFGSINI